MTRTRAEHKRLTGTDGHLIGAPVPETPEAGKTERYWALVPENGLMTVRPVAAGSSCPRCGDSVELWLGPGDHEYTLACNGWGCGYQLEILRNA